MDGSTVLNIPNEIQFCSVPKDIVFPDELNRYLKEQIEYLLHENGMLNKHFQENQLLLKQKSDAFENLSLKLKEYENIENKHQFSSPTTIASSKIVELSKRLREKNAEVESLKTKCGKLDKKVCELQEEVQKKEYPQTEPSEDSLNSEKSNDDRLKKIRHEFNVTSMKLREVQNSNIQLKNELKMANKYLQQEVGESLENISTNNQGWRGRAQIICDLQQKNQELKDKLRAYQGKAAICNGTENTPKVEKRLDNLTKENDELKSNLSDQKRKTDVLRARCKVLENEQAMNKSKISSFISQSERDQSLLQTLTNQVTNQQEATSDILKQKDKQIKGLQEDNEMLRIELSKQRVVIDNLTKNLNDKIDEIKELMKNKRKSPRPVSSYGQKNRNILDEKLVNRLEVEKARLLEYTELQAKRLQNEKEAHSKTQNSLRLQRQKAAKLETNLAKLELEISGTKSGGSYYVLSTSHKSTDTKSVDDLKDELELAQETAKAFKTRLEIEQRERKVDLKEFAKILESNNL